MAVMVDWVTAQLEVGPRWFDSHPVWDSGRLLTIAPGGVARGMRPLRAAVEGSHSSNFTWYSRTGYEMELSGNPVKWLQGHNLFGPGDPRGLFFAAGWELRGRGVPFPSPGSFVSNDCRLKFTRVDLTRSYRFPSDEDARAWIAAVGPYSKTRRGGAAFETDTVYFGKESRYWSMKIYLKSDEIRSRRRGHGLPYTLSERDHSELHEWAVGVVRFEVTLRGRELALIGEAARAGFMDPVALWQTYFERVDLMGVSVKTLDFDPLDPRLSALPAGARLALVAWSMGNHAALAGVPRTTLFRYRRAIRECVGIDIAVPRPGVEPAVADVGLDAAGWDPDPIARLMYQVDDSLIGAYGGGGGA